MPADLAIAASDLVKTYPGDVRAVRGVSLAVPAGTVFGLLGPNGAGKSSTVKILTTLTKATSGTAVVAGHDVDRQPDAVRRSIGCVFQKHAVDPEATGRENLLLQGHLYGLRGAALRARTTELLGRFGLADEAGRLVRTWSGGMQRKLDVAMGLVHHPRCCSWTSRPPGWTRRRGPSCGPRSPVWPDNEGLTVLLTTHYLEEADRLADQLVIVDRGRVVAAGTAERLKSELRGDALVVELATAPGGPAGAARRARAQPGRADAAGQGRRRRPARCRRCWPGWRRPG